MESEDDETVVDTGNEMAMISKQFKSLIQTIPMRELGSEEHSKAAVIIQSLEEQFDKLITLKTANKKSVKSGSGSYTPVISDDSRYVGAADRRDAFMVNALDKISSALELLQRKPGEIPGLQNSVSWPEDKTVLYCSFHQFSSSVSSFSF